MSAACVAALPLSGVATPTTDQGREVLAENKLSELTPVELLQAQQEASAGGALVFDGDAVPVTNSDLSAGTSLSPSVGATSERSQTSASSPVPDREGVDRSSDPEVEFRGLDEETIRLILKRFPDELHNSVPTGPPSPRYVDSHGDPSLVPGPHGRGREDRGPVETPPLLSQFGDLSPALVAELRAAPHFGQLNAIETDEFIELLSKTDAAGQRELMKLLTQERNGKPLLRATDSQGRSVLANMAALVSEDLVDPRLEEQRGDLIAALAKSIHSPLSITQGYKGACAATEPMREFAQLDPAEYSRLVSELLRTGTAVFRSGEMLTLELDTIAADGSGRNVIERVVQSSFMEFANGSEYDYRNKSDAHFCIGEEEEQGRNRYGGLPDYQRERLMEAFHGYEFTAQRSHDRDALMNEVKENLPGTVQATLRWSTADASGAGVGADGGRHAYHAVRVLKIENGRVYFSNPWGPTDRIAGSELTDPPARVEDPANGIYSMSEADFKDRLRGVIKPQEFGLESVRETLREAPGRVVRAVGEAVEQVKEVGQAVVERAAAAVNSVVEDAKRGVQAVGAWISSWF